MATILVAKTGGAISVGRSTAKSEGFETVNVIWHLNKMGHKVILFGVVNGDTKMIEDHCQIIRPNLDGMKEDVTPGEFEERMAPALEEIRDLKPCVWINMFGGGYSRSIPTGETKMMAAAVRYSAPILYVCSKMCIPRVMVVSDPKTILREIEITRYPQLVPAAILSQWDNVRKQSLFGSRYRVVDKHAKVEYWETQHLPINLDLSNKRYDIVVAANTHADNGKVDGGRMETWHQILDGFKGNVAICGDGWYGWEPKEQWLGVLPNRDRVHELMHQGWAGPMIPQVNGFATTKIRLKAMQGCVPIPHGRGGPLTYDLRGEIIPLDHPCRVLGKYDLERAFQYARNHRQEMLHMVLEKTRPDFSMLDEVVDLVQNGYTLEGFGGMKKIG